MTARCTSLHSGSGGQAPCGRGSCTGSIHPRTLLYNCNKQTVLGKARLSDTGTCRPLYGEQRCIIQTEHSRRYRNMSSALRRAALYNTDWAQHSRRYRNISSALRRAALYNRLLPFKLYTALPSKFNGHTALPHSSSCLHYTLISRYHWPWNVPKLSRRIGTTNLADVLFHSAKVNTAMPTAFISAAFWFPRNLHDDKPPHTDLLYHFIWQLGTLDFCFPLARRHAPYPTNKLFRALQVCSKLSESTGSYYRQLSGKVTSPHIDMQITWLHDPVTITRT